MHRSASGIGLVAAVGGTAVALSQPSAATWVVAATAVAALFAFRRALWSALPRVSPHEVAWLLLLVSTLSVDTLTTSEVFAGSIGSAQLLRLGLLAVALGITMPALMRGGLPLRSAAIWSYALFVCVALLSVIWSSAPIATAGKAVEVFAALSVVLVAGRGSHVLIAYSRLMVLTLMFMAGVLIAVGLGAIAEPDTYRKFIRLTGEYTLDGGPLPISANAIARFGSYVSLSLIAVALFVGSLPIRRWLVLLTAGVFAVFPFLSHGRTGIASLLIGVLVLMCLRGPLHAVAGLAVATLGLAMYGPAAWDYFRRGQDAEQFAALSGRVGWWESASQGLHAEPIIGFGFGVGGRTTFVHLGLDSVSGLHNGPLEILTGVGLLGGAPWAIAFLVVSVTSARQLVRGRSVELHVLIIPLLFATVLSSGAGGWLSAELMLFLALLGLGALASAAGFAKAPGVHPDARGLI